MENQNGRMYFRSDPVKYCSARQRAFALPSAYVESLRVKQMQYLLDIKQKRKVFKLF